MSLNLFPSHDRAAEDSLNEVVAEVVDRFSTDYVVIVMSGRDESCRNDTVEWLYEYGVPFGEKIKFFIEE